MRVLIVEDDPELAHALRDGFRDMRIEATTSATFAEGRERALLASHDVIVLDVMLPGRVGVRSVRPAARTRRGHADPDAHRARRAWTIACAGWTPAPTTTLPSRSPSGAAGARARAGAAAPPAVASERVQVADLEVDLATRQVQRAGRDIELTAKEFALLEVFVRHAGQVLDRAAITAHVWDENHDPFTNVLEVLVRRLRRKIDDDFEPKLIHTLRGAGYRFGP